MKPAELTAFAQLAAMRVAAMELRHRAELLDLAFAFNAPPPADIRAEFVQDVARALRVVRALEDPAIVAFHVDRDRADWMGAAAELRAGLELSQVYAGAVDRLVRRLAVTL